MAYKSSFLLLCATSVLCVLVSGQNPPMGASTGLGPGDTFSLFVTFQEPMPKIEAMNCSFRLIGAPKQGQEHFGVSFGGSGTATKIDDTHYRTQVSIPQGVADGDYQLLNIGVGIGRAYRQYEGNALPTLAPVAITNHDHLKFSDIKKLDIQK